MGCLKEVTTMEAERRTIQGRPETGAGPIKPFAITLATMGGLALVQGLWGLLRPEQQAAMGEAAVTDVGLRLGAGLLIWLAMVALAWYVTARWETLRWWQGAAAWILVTYLWIGGMVVMRIPVEPYQMVLGRVLDGDVAPRFAGLVSFLAGMTLLAMAATVWREQQAEASGRPEARPRPRAGTSHPLPRPSAA